MSQVHPVEYVVPNLVTSVAFMPPIEVEQICTPVSGDNNIGDKVFSGLLTRSEGKLDCCQFLMYHAPIRDKDISPRY